LSPTSQKRTPSCKDSQHERFPSKGGHVTGMAYLKQHFIHDAIAEHLLRAKAWLPGNLQPKSWNVLISFTAHITVTFLRCARSRVLSHTRSLSFSLSPSIVLLFRPVLLLCPREENQSDRHAFLNPCGRPGVAWPRVEGADGLLRGCQPTATGTVGKVCRNGGKMPVIEAWALRLGGTPRARPGRVPIVSVI